MYLDKFESIAELAVRCILFLYYIITSYLKPRVREIHDEEWWLYMNPTGNNYVSFRLLIVVVVLNILVYPLVSILMNRSRNGVIISAVLGYSLATLLNISITNTLKLLVGRPRPDFYFRCFTDGKRFSNCNGDDNDITEGLKSFPSGHSSMAMAAFGFTSLFLIGQFRLFAETRIINESNEKSFTKLRFFETGRFLGCKLILSILPMSISVLVCVSRLLDFHHHYDDIAAGASIGLTVAFISYRLYFPSVFDSKSNCPKFEYEIVKSRKINSRSDGVDFTV